MIYVVRSDLASSPHRTFSEGRGGFGFGNAEVALGRCVVCGDVAAGGGISAQGGGGGEGIAVRKCAAYPGDGAWGGTRLRRRGCAEAAWDRRVAGANESHPRDQRGRWRRGGAAGRDHGRVPGAGAAAWAALSAGP